MLPAASSLEGADASAVADDVELETFACLGEQPQASLPLDGPGAHADASIVGDKVCREPLQFQVLEARAGRSPNYGATGDKT